MNGLLGVLGIMVEGIRLILCWVKFDHESNQMNIEDLYTVFLWFLNAALTLSSDMPFVKNCGSSTIIFVGTGFSSTSTKSPHKYLFLTLYD